MKASQSDLIAIVNADLSKKLEKKAEQKEKLDNVSSQAPINATSNFARDAWKAVYVLNLFRYALSIALIGIIISPTLFPSFDPSIGQSSPRLFLLTVIILLISAVIFTITSSAKSIDFNTQVTAQFSLDLVLSALIIYCNDSIPTNFIILFFIVVATGSVVLPRIHALGLAAGAVILMFYEHIYSSTLDSSPVDAEFGLLATFSIGLFILAAIIAWLAERIRLAEMKSFMPGNESIETFLIREEKNALINALKQTDGNKTEAAKLLGMTFRSFRYKLTKYDIAQTGTDK